MKYKRYCYQGSYKKLTLCCVSILQCFSKTFSKTDLDNLRFTPSPTEGGIRLLNLDNCTEQFILSHMVTNIFLLSHTEQFLLNLDNYKKQFLLSHTGQFLLNLDSPS